MDEKYKEMVDERIQRDSSQKELVDGHYVTAAMLKKAVKQFKEQHEGKMSEELRSLDNMLKSNNNNNKIKVKINLNPLVKASLPFLHVGLSRTHLFAKFRSVSASYCLEKLRNDVSI